MVIEVAESLLHWNYFLALEDDLDQVSRYVEFDEDNFDTFSIELAHLLLASSSEIDVIAKGVCKLLAPDEDAGSIGDYRTIIKSNLPTWTNEEVKVPRYNLTLHPWTNWNDEDRNPDWWMAYNRVKHERDNHFSEANLKNALNSVAALLITVFHYYRLTFEYANTEHNWKKTNKLLKPTSSLMRLPGEYYFDNVVV